MKQIGFVCDICKSYVADAEMMHELQHTCGDDVEVFDVCGNCFNKMKKQPFNKAAWLYEMRTMMKENGISYEDISEQFSKGDRLHYRYTVSSVLTNNGAKSKSLSMERVEEAIRNLAEQRRKNA